MYFVHPQIKLKSFIKAKLSLVKSVDLEGLTQKLVAYFPAKQLIFTDMGRTAFRLIIEKLNLQNTAMLLPAYICDIFYPILKEYNIKPIFLDINLKTFHIGTDEIQKKITPNSRAILVCHTYGLPFDVDALRSDLRGRSDLVIIEDCAHSFLDGTGNSGDVSFFSLYKQFPALRGGMLACPNDWQIKLPKTYFNFRDFISFLNYFWPFALFFKKFGSEIAPKMPRREKMRELGGLNRVSLNLFSDFFEATEKSSENRKTLAIFFQKELKALGFEVQNTDGNVFCYLSSLTPRNIQDKRDVIVQKLKKYGVFCTRIWHAPIILNEGVQREYQIDLADFPNTVEAAKRIINFPLQNHYTEKDVRKIITAVKKVIANL
ncbi:MAG: hypothetical protein A2896_00405 [Candidatus Nealsonbacteria bacterium RIFCSPLOWO2_01_FULL_43_32]|uniref:DegT/DnrJ/EryC1/StrS aminotransferase n=1 Tax=Candidatus Nealsonbacteria bacterium RIFCSPLOWO2_01_FULL_43_32 TaxID=1801672 RepID=A0A1G2EF12_9BACT|nr:MAG: hypothetical protein A2896_00405 [Candidatus Nealsonbacteria bacterium RIFCSPLOWO2_01_FULL_43_32]